MKMRKEIRQNRYGNKELFEFLYNYTPTLYKVYVLTASNGIQIFFILEIKAPSTWSYPVVRLFEKFYSGAEEITYENNTICCLS